MAKRSSSASANRGPIRVGLVGAGRAGWGMHVPEIVDRPRKFRLVNVCDLLRPRRQQAAERLGCATAKRIDDLLADETVELVTIATRSCDHVAHASAALKAGKHVFLEKPMATDLPDARKLVSLAKRSKGVLFINHNRRFEPGFLHVREIVESGILGKVYEIKLRRMEFQFRGDWQTLRRFGGGQLLNWGPHIIDHALQFLGGKFKLLSADLKRIAAVGDAEDHLKIILTGPTGCLVDLEISGGAALGEPTYHIFGTRGALTCDDQTITIKHLDPAATIIPTKADLRTPGFDGAPPIPNHVLVRHGRSGRSDHLPTWIERNLMVSPKRPTTTWDAVHATLRKNTPYPITHAQALAVMKIIDTARTTAGPIRRPGS